MHRRLILLSIVNAILAMPHAWARSTASFEYLQWAISVSRILYGVLEFTAFVLASLLGGTHGAVMFVILSILGTASMYIW